MNKPDEMFTHIEKLVHDRWLIVNHWDQHPTLDQNELVDAPLPHYQEFEGPIEEIRRESFYVILVEPDLEGLTHD